MKLDGTALKTLRQLAVELLDYDDLTMIVSDAGRDIETFTSPNADKVKAAFATLHAANNGDWMPAFIEGFRALRPGNKKLEDFIAALPVATAAAGDPYAASYPDNRPFVNRVTLRGTLPALVNGQARILVVKGDRRSGKTHTGNLIKALAKNVGFEVVNVNLVPYAQSRDVLPIDIGGALALQMGLGKPPELGNEQLSRWTLSYFDWLVGQVRTRDAEAAARAELPKTWWIVIDGFQSISVPPAVNDFVDELCARVDSTFLAMRVVLISYERELAPEIDPILRTDVTGAITLADLTTFFVQFYREHKPAAADIDQRASTHASAVVALMDKAAAAPVEVMGRELIDRCRKILQEVP